MKANNPIFVNPRDTKVTNKNNTVDLNYNIPVPIYYTDQMKQ